MIRMMLTVCGMATACIACTSTPAEPPRSFVLIEENVTIPFSHTISAFERVDDDTYLFRVNANRWYKAELRENCGRGVLERHTIRIDTGQDPSSRVDTFSVLVLDGLRRCRIQKLDRIASPGSQADA